jgi:hypothetical protein
MPSDPHDELARRRAGRDRDRGTPSQDAVEDPSRSADQAAAIARARESWLLSRVRRNQADDDTTSDSDRP